jgi:hypothetical protein
MNGYGSEVGIVLFVQGMWFLLGLALSGMTLCSGLEEWRQSAIAVFGCQIRWNKKTEF